MHLCVQKDKTTRSLWIFGKGSTGGKEGGNKGGKQFLSGRELSGWNRGKKPTVVNADRNLCLL